MKLKAIAMAGALILSGCATQAEQTCRSGKALDGLTVADTCLIGQSDRNRINSELWVAAGVAVVGLTVAAVALDANRPSYQPTQTVIVNNAAPQVAKSAIPAPVIRGESQQALMAPIWRVNP